MTQPKIIVVDDDPLIAKFVAKVAQSIGMEVRAVTSALEFQQSWHAEKSDAVVLDIVMPNMDGIELIEWLAGQDRDVSVIIISAYGDRYVDMARRIGKARGMTIVGTLEKPLDFDRLRAVLQKIPI